MECGKREAGGFEVALHADFELPRGGEPRGIDDGGSDFFTVGLGVWAARDVIGAGAVAALAIDALGERAGVEGLGAGIVVAGGNLRVGVVAEHALVGDRAVGENVVAIVAGAHGPVAAVLGIPAERRVR